jgi:hypothetical protein
MNTDELTFSYSDILVFLSNLNEPRMNNVEELRKHLSFNLDIGIFYIAKKETLNIDFDIRLYSEEIDHTIYIIELRHVLKLTNTQDYLEQDEEGHYLNIPSEQLQAMISVAYSTTRGIIRERLGGSRFSGVLMPIINIQDLKAEGRIEALLDEDNQ